MRVCVRVRAREVSHVKNKTTLIRLTSLQTNKTIIILY